MPSKFKVGDIVRKAAGAGFTMQEGIGVIPHGEPDGCLICFDDPDCYEWDDLWMVNASTLEQAKAEIQAKRFIGNCCHVSECQMERLT